ncbi:hypothetical protein BJ165DRAFT_1407643 [Panaeolus papilionaceus]|nr:hypothetical protein BJ165DRAFT_1407643 [Panaeolus papilionaceus]
MWRDVHITDHPVRFFKLIRKVKIRTVTVDTGGPPLKVYYIDVPLNEPDLMKFTAYTRRVRTLDYTFSNDFALGTARGVVHPSLFSYVISLLKGEPLFPNLRTLKISGRVDRWDLTGPMSTYLPHLSSPHLQQLTFSLEGEEKNVPDVWMLLYSFGQKPDHRLTRLNLTLPISLIVIEALPTLGSLGSLEHLDIPATILDFPSLLRLTALENLKVLTVGFKYRFAISGSTGTFAQLKSLGLTSLCNPASFVHLFESIDFKALVTFKIVFSDEYMKEHRWKLEWDKYFCALADRFPKLRTFKLGSVVRNTEWNLPWSNFAPLLGLGNLVQFAINGPYLRSLTNEDVIQIISAWPKLEILTLLVWTHSSVDHTALSAIAKGLGMLVKLDIPVDLSSLVIEASPKNSLSNSIANPSASSSKVKHLIIGHPLRPVRRRDFDIQAMLSPFPPASNTQEMHRLARFLDELFPYLSMKDAVLQSPSLLTEFFSFLQPSYIFYYYGNNSSLLAATLVCRAFQEPALDALWREIRVVDHPTALFKLIPAINFRRVTFPRELSQMVLLDLIYTGTKKPKLTMADTIHPSLITCIAPLLNGELLFPNLRRLYINSRAGEPTHMCSTMPTYLPLIVSPRIEYLGIDIAMAESNLPLDLIPFSTNLARVNDKHLTQPLSFLKHLQVLSLGLHKDIHIPNEVATIATFAALQSLTFKNLGSPQIFSHFFCATRFPSLKSITLDPFWRGKRFGVAPGPLQDYLGPIADRHQKPDNLEVVRFEGSDITFTALVIFFPFTAPPPSPPSLHFRMIQAWPEMKTLIIDTHPHVTTADHDGLLFIAQGFTKLTTLEFPFVLSGSIPSAKLSRPSVPELPSKLRKLKINLPVARVLTSKDYKSPLPSNSDIKAIHQLARYMHNLFPCLKEVGCDDSRTRAALEALTEFLHCIKESTVVMVGPDINIQELEAFPNLGPVKKLQLQRMGQKDNEILKWASDFCAED